jgi:uncharacterized protein (DUF302 family)
MSTVTHPHPYALTATTPLSFDDAVAAAKQALAEENFGVLCEIDVQATLKAKLDEDIDPYLILGACNPPYAHQAIGTEFELGALLPCNVVVAVKDGLTTIFAVDPERMLAIAENPDLEPIAHEVHRRLQRVVDTVAAAA